MNQVLEILKYILPSLVTFGAAWYVLKAFLENEQKKQLLQIRMKGGEVAMPVRLQAFERILLLLERISIHNLLIRASLPGSDAATLHQHLVNTVRQEFDHNLAQQLYISNDAWELVRSAKEEVLRVLNSTYAELPEGATGKDFAERAMEQYVKMKRPLTVEAIRKLKKEAALLF